MVAVCGGAGAAEGEAEVGESGGVGRAEAAGEGG